MKIRSLRYAFVFLLIVGVHSLHAELLFEDDFSTQASLDNWVLNLGGDSTVEVVEAAEVNMDGYLKVFDGDPEGLPEANYNFGPTETGYLDVRMSGTKWAGAGVLVIRSADGPLFGFTMSVTNTDVQGSLNAVLDLEERENDVFVEPMNLALEGPSFPYGRDVRLTWSNGTISMYYTGLEGTVYYTRLNKAFNIPEATPVSVSLAAGYRSVSGGKTGYFDFIKVYAGLPDSGPGSGSTWALWPILDGAGTVDTGGWMGYLNVNSDPYIWSHSATQWLYIDNGGVTENGSWTYIFNF